MHDHIATSRPPAIKNTNEKVDPAALLGTALAGTLTIILAQGPFNALEVPIGIVLLLALIAHDQPLVRSRLQTWAFGAACGFALFITFGWLLEFGHTNGETYNYRRPEGYMSPGAAALYWLGFTAISLLFDKLYRDRHVPIVREPSQRCDETSEKGSGVPSASTTDKKRGKTSTGSAAPMTKFLQQVLTCALTAFAAAFAAAKYREDTERRRRKAV